MGIGARGMSVSLEGSGGTWCHLPSPPRDFAQLSTFEQAPPSRVKGPLYSGGCRHVPGRLMIEIYPYIIVTWLDGT